MAISEDSVAQVVSPGSVETLESMLSSSQSSLDSAMTVAQEHWLRVPEVFQVSGAEGADFLLDPSSRAVQEWAEALGKARRALSDAAMFSLPTLVSRRENLLARVVEVNRQASDAAGAAEVADSQYWSAYGKDPESSSTTTARQTRTDALHGQEAASEAVTALKADIERFRRDVEEEEESLAGVLKGIGGGDEVLGAWGAESRVSQTFWGFAEQAYPGGPQTGTDLAGHLQEALAEASVARVNWLSMVDAEDARAWVDAHPEFASAVGFIDPEVAARLWDGLVSESTRGPLDSGAEQWTAGPLAQLFAVAPFAIGNMNGLKARDRDEFNRETLRQVALDPNATPEQREAAEQTQKALERAQAQAPAGTVVQLLALELPSDGGERDMRAAISVGDLDSAEDVGVMIPGMNSSVSESIYGLAGNAVNMQEANVRIGNPDTTATVVWMGYESPGNIPLGRGYVGEESLAQTGALSLGRFLNGIDVANAAAETTVHAHSYATRVATYALSGGEFGGAKADHLVMYGSPGIAESVRTVDALPGVPADEVYSTKSSGDSLNIPTLPVLNPLFPLLPASPPLVSHLVLSLTTESSGWQGVAGMGEMESDIRGNGDNPNPNDAEFWGKHDRNVFTSTGVLGHSIDQTENSDGYWSPSSDPLVDGARIMAGQGGDIK